MNNKPVSQKLKDLMRNPGFIDHPAPVTRRDFIKLGMVAGGGLLFSHRLLARAAGPKTFVPFLTFDLAGGAGLAANFLVGQKGGPEDLCERYQQHGWNPRAAGALDKTYGLPMAKSASKILEGIKEALPAELQEENQVHFKMASFIHFSLDDTNTNRSSAVTLVAKAGLKGSVIRAGLGMISSSSGGNSDVYLREASLKPIAISSPAEVSRLSSYGDDFESLDPKTRSRIFSMLKAAGSVGLQQVYEQLASMGMSDRRMDPLSDQNLARIYGINASQSSVQAAIVHNVIHGYTGPGVITIGGCDYHDNTQTTGDMKDREIGLSIGRAVHAAYLAGKPLMFHVLSDGGVYAPGSDNFERIWRGDANQHSMSIIGLFDPNKEVKLRRLQVGHFTAKGQVEQDTLVGKGPEKMAVGVLANYLHLNGLLPQAEELTGLRLQPYEIDQMLVFE